MPEVADPTRAGYNFIGWNTSADGTGENIDENTIVKITAQTNIYANWELKDISITFDAGDGG